MFKGFFKRVEKVGNETNDYMHSEHEAIYENINIKLKEIDNEIDSKIFSEGEFRQLVRELIGLEVKARMVICHAEENKNEYTLRIFKEIKDDIVTRINRVYI